MGCERFRSPRRQAPDHHLQYAGWHHGQPWPGAGLSHHANL